MSPLGRVMSAFPAVFVLLVLGLGWWCPPVGVAVLYLLPPLLYRLHERLFPLREGLHRLVGATYVPWWGGHQLQVLYIALPGLEAVLRATGLYSPWLRLWGAKVGRRVYWTPLVEVTDRALLTIGDDVVIGHRCGFYAHVIKPHKGNLLLYVRRIEVGDAAFLAAGCGLGPGARVDPGAFLPLRTELFPNRRFEA